MYRLYERDVTDADQNQVEDEVGKLPICFVSLRNNATKKNV